MGGIAKVFGALAVVAGLSAAPPTLAADTAAPAHVPCTGVDLWVDLQAVITACEALITSGKLQGDDLAEALRHQGDAYFRSFRVDLAFENYGKALELKPNWARALWNLGNAAAVLGHSDLAMQSTQRAIEADPTFSKAHTALATRLWAAGDLEGAFKEFARALELDPKEYLARYNRALLYSKLGRHLEALHDLEELLAEDEASLNRTYLFKSRMPDEDFVGDLLRSRAIELRDMGSYDEALASLQKALDRKPGWANAATFRSELIRTIADKQRFAEALAAIDRAMELHPDSPEMPDLSMEGARLLIAMDRKDEARAIATESARFESAGNGTFFLDRSNVWEKLKEFDRAKADLVRGMSTDRQSFEAAMQSMQKAGYLMSWQGLDPEVAMANAIIACVHDAWC